MIVSIARTSDIEIFGGILTISEVHGDFEKKNIWSFYAVLCCNVFNSSGIFIMTIKSVCRCRSEKLICLKV